MTAKNPQHPAPVVGNCYEWHGPKHTFFMGKCTHSVAQLAEMAPMLTGEKYKDIGVINVENNIPRAYLDPGQMIPSGSRLFIRNATGGEPKERGGLSEDEEEHRLNVLHMARRRYQCDGDIEFDDDAKISEGDLKNGAYVQCWKWVAFSGTDLDTRVEE